MTLSHQLDAIRPEVFMRSIPLLCLAAMLSSCAAVPQPVGRSPANQQRLAAILADRVAGPAASCVPSHRSSDMSVIDGRTVAYRGGGTVYVMQLNEGCELLAGGGYTMVTRQYGGAGLCSGDIVQVANLQSRTTVGSCTVGPIVTYSRARR
jgi:hypothetical protein